MRLDKIERLTKTQGKAYMAYLKISIQERAMRDKVDAIRQKRNAALEALSEVGVEDHGCTMIVGGWRMTPTCVFLAPQVAAVASVFSWGDGPRLCADVDGIKLVEESTHENEKIA